jgi:putative FmdB family regulatory protein
MPLYEYHCPSCNKTHEVMQKFSDPPLATCPDCGKPVEKMVSLSSFALKGSGWYTTDYAKKSSPKPAGDSEKAPEKAPAEKKSAEAPAPGPKADPKPKKSD